MKKKGRELIRDRLEEMLQSQEKLGGLQDDFAAALAVNRGREPAPQYGKPWKDVDARIKEGQRLDVLRIIPEEKGKTVPATIAKFQKHLKVRKKKQWNTLKINTQITQCYLMKTHHMVNF